MESGDRLNQIEPLLAEISRRLGEMDARLDKFGGILGEIVEKLDEIAGRLDGKTDINSDEIKKRFMEHMASQLEIKSILTLLKNKN